MLKICLARQGKNRKPSYRIVVLEKRAATHRTYIDLLGWYNPRSHSNEDMVKIDVARTHEWIARGATPSPTVAALLKRTEKPNQVS